MAVFSLLERYRSIINSVLDRRVAAEDIVEWDCGLEMMMVPEHDEEGNHVGVEATPIVLFVIRLCRFDQHGKEVFSSETYAPLPLDIDDESLISWMDGTWDELVLRGMDLTIDIDSP